MNRLILLCILAFPVTLFGAKCSTTSSGNWTDNIWGSCPAPNDSVISGNTYVIAEGDTVLFASLNNLTFHNSSQLTVYGVLDLNNKKLEFPNNEDSTKLLVKSTGALTNMNEFFILNGDNGSEYSFDLGSRIQTKYFRSDNYTVLNVNSLGGNFMVSERFEIEGNSQIVGDGCIDFFPVNGYLNTTKGTGIFGCKSKNNVNCFPDNANTRTCGLDLPPVELVCAPEINVNDTSTYLSSNGYISGNKFNVSNGTGWIQSKNYTLDATGKPARVSFTWVVNPTGNLESGDDATLYYTVNGSEILYFTHDVGINGNAKTTYSIDVLVPSEATISYKTKFYNNEVAEKWSFTDGDGKACHGDDNPLPVELIDFEATLDFDLVNINWSTASESNNSHFTIERSLDAKNFQEINRVDGAGNSKSKIEYNVIDYNPKEGVSYYRLVQHDYNGKSKISSVRAVENIIEENEEVTFKVYPNPNSVNNDIYLEVKSGNDQNIFFSIHNSSGVELHSFVKRPNDSDLVTIKTNDLSLLPGLYFIKGLINEGFVSIKLIIN